MVRKRDFHKNKYTIYVGHNEIDRETKIETGIAFGMFEGPVTILVNGVYTSLVAIRKIIIGEKQFKGMVTIESRPISSS